MVSFSLDNGFDDVDVRELSDCVLLVVRFGVLELFDSSEDDFCVIFFVEVGKRFANCDNGSHMDMAAGISAGSLKVGSFDKTFNGIVFEWTDLESEEFF